MFEKFTRENSRDFATRYQGTYGFFYREGTKKFLTRLEVVEDVVRFVDYKGVSYELYPDSEEDTGFEFLPPKAGYFNTTVGAMLVQRRAQRQFSRGISERNTLIYLMNEMGPIPQPVNFGVLLMVYESALTARDNWGQFVAGKIPSVALGHQLALTATHVYVYEASIGRVVERTKDKVKLTLKNDQFKTELKDNFRDVVEVEFV